MDSFMRQMPEYVYKYGTAFWLNCAKTGKSASRKKKANALTVAGARRLFKAFDMPINHFSGHCGVVNVIAFSRSRRSSAAKPPDARQLHQGAVFSSLLPRRSAFYQPL
jgi:hypothetical protein